jgi:hypothetical protein
MLIPTAVPGELGLCTEVCSRSGLWRQSHTGLHDLSDVAQWVASTSGGPLVTYIPGLGCRLGKRWAIHAGQHGEDT